METVAPIIAMLAFNGVYVAFAIHLRSAVMWIAVAFHFVLLVAVVVAGSAGSSWAEGLFVTWFSTCLLMFFVALLCLQRRDVASLRMWMQGKGYELMEAHYSIPSPRSQESFVFRFLARSSEGIAKSGYAVVHHKASREDALEVTWDADEEDKSSAANPGMERADDD